MISGLYIDILYPYILFLMPLSNIDVYRSVSADPESHTPYRTEIYITLLGLV